MINSCKQIIDPRSNWDNKSVIYFFWVQEVSEFSWGENHVSIRHDLIWISKYMKEISCLITFLKAVDLVEEKTNINYNQNIRTHTRLTYGNDPYVKSGKVQIMCQWSALYLH